MAIQGHRRVDHGTARRGHAGKNMAGARQTHIFLDTTEVMPSDPASAIGDVGRSALREATGKIGARLYVPDLVIDEVAQKRMREFEERLARMKSFKAYVEIGSIPRREDLLERFKAETVAELGKLSAEIFPVEKMVSLPEILSLSKEQVAPLRGKTLSGFHDAVILLSSLQYARDAGLDDCWFLSQDTGFQERELERLAKNHNVSMKLFRGSNEAIAVVGKMLAVKLSSLEDELPKEITAFVNGNIAFVHAYLEKHSLRLPYIAFPQSRQFTTTHIRAAVPDGRVTENAECRFTFYLPLYPVPPRNRFGLQQTLGELGSPAEMANYRPLALTVGLGEGYGLLTGAGRESAMSGIGKARALYKEGKLIGTPSIDFIGVSPR